MECENHQALRTSWEFCEMVYKYYSSEEETQVYTKSEEPHKDKSSVEIHIIMPPLFIKEYM